MAYFKAPGTECFACFAGAGFGIAVYSRNSTGDLVIR
jgi:hypothetical protein